jgi:autotransporter-associated beta strand protein
VVESLAQPLCEGEQIEALSCRATTDCWIAGQYQGDAEQFMLTDLETKSREIVRRWTQPTGLLRILFVGWLLGLSGMVQPARAFVHPGIPFTLSDLNTVKSNLTVQPWASGYAALARDSHSATNYRMQGPFTWVARNWNGWGTNVNLTQWDNDMQAAYYQSLMWYFTSNSVYAQNAHNILVAWANTLTNFTGYEGAFEVGGNAAEYVTAADILRATWPSWTTADTTNLQVFFTNVYWPVLLIPGTVMSANQGGYEMMGAVAIAVFCDDTNKLNQAITSLTTDSNAGFRDTLSNGQVGDYQRDQGHSFWQTYQVAWAAEVLWKQGVDVFSLFDNRILATTEYYGRYNLPGSNPAFIQFGATYDGATYKSALASTNQGAPRSSTQDRMNFNIVQGAYGVRMGLDTPWTTLYLNDQTETADSFVYRKSADISIATNKVTVSFPLTASLSTGLASADLNGATPAGNTAYNNGVWTLKSGYGGGDPWNTGSGNDTVHFAWRQVTGDFTMIAQVLSVANVGSISAKAGIMLRDSLGTATNRFYGAMTAATNFERVVVGWTNMPYGANMASASSPVSPIPYWVKMERAGNRVQVFQSVDGADWSPACVADMPAMPSTVYVGLFGTSLVTGSASTATFANVRITGGDGLEAPKIPPAPFAIYAAPGDAQVPLRWNEAFNATGYNVKRSLTNGGYYTTIATVTNTIYTDTNVIDGTTYFYVATATNSAGESSNSIQDSAAPQLTMVNVAVSGSALANADDAADGSGAAQAFDINPGTKWFNGNAGTNGWLQYDLGLFIRQTVRRYAITSANDVPGRDPVDWQFLASNDGSAWTRLDAQTNQMFPYRYQTLTYAVGNTNAYRFYRFSITSNNGDPTGLQLSELALLAIAGTGTNIASSALVWSGAASGTWDVATANWLSNGVAVTYQNGSAVLFDDTASGGTTVSLIAPLSPSAITFNNSAKTYIFSGSAIGGAATILKAGGGTVNLNSANTFSGGITLSGGTVAVGNNSALGAGTVTLSGGTLNNTAGNLAIANSINVAVTTTTAIQAVNGNNWTLAGNITGSGMIHQTANGSTAQVGLGGDNSGFSGTWIQDPGNTSLRFDNASAGSANAAWVFNESQYSQRTRFNFGTGAINFGSLSGGAGSVGLANISAGAVVATLTVGALNTSTTFAGTMEANGANGIIALTKVGTGTLTLTGPNAYTGLTTVSNGELVVSTVFGGKGNFWVTNAATLGVTNLSGTSALVSNLTVAAGTALEFQNVSSTATPLVLASNVAVGGSCTVKITGTNGLVAGNSYLLIKYAGNLSGAFTNLQLQMPYGWRGTLVNSGNQISLASVAVVSSTQPQLNTTLNGRQLQLQWPFDHIGWRLLMNTNLVSTNWLGVPGAGVTNLMLVSPTNGSVFFRLVYP